MRTLGRFLVLAGIGAFVAAVTVAGPVASRDTATVVDGHTVPAVRRNLVVVAIDPAFLREADANYFTWPQLVAGLLLHKPALVEVESAVLTEARAQMTPADVALFAGQYGQSGASTVDELLAPFVRQLPDVVLAYDTTRSQGNGPRTVHGQFPTAALGDAVTSTGFTSVPLATSGIGRLLFPVALRPSPSPARAVRLPAAALEVAYPNHAVDWQRARLGPDHLRFAGTSIPVEEGVGLRVQYSDRLLRGGAQVVKASDLIRGGTDRENVLEGRTVLIGVDAPGSVRVPAPVAGGSVAPVYVTANAVNTMLTGQYLVPDSTMPRVAYGLIAALAVAALWAFAPWWIALLVSVVAAFAWRWYVLSQLDHGHLLSLYAVIGPIVVVSLVALGWKLITALRHRHRVSQLFSRYVPARVADQLMEGNLAEELATGHRHTLTALFVDLRGFTPLSASLDPSEIRRLLDHFYDYITRRVLAEDGTVMQFVGDEVYAVFGAPLERADHTAAALRAALAIQTDLGELDAVLAADGLPPVHFGIGLHTGPAVAAHVGTPVRRQYTVIGDTVNIASRCCSAADADQIVATGATIGETAPDAYEPLGPQPLKGVAEPVPLYRYGTGPIRLATK